MKYLWGQVGGAVVRPGLEGSRDREGNDSGPHDRNLARTSGPGTQMVETYRQGARGINISTSLSSLWSPADAPLTEPNQKPGDQRAIDITYSMHRAKSQVEQKESGHRKANGNHLAHPTSPFRLHQLIFLLCSFTATDPLIAIPDTSTFPCPQRVWGWGGYSILQWWSSILLAQGPLKQETSHKTHYNQLRKLHMSTQGLQGIPQDK